MNPSRVWQKRLRNSRLFGALAISSGLFIYSVVWAVPSTLAKPLFDQALNANEKNARAPYQRLDFQVRGASCVTCIRRVAKALRHMRGVIKADISIYYPYWAVVVLDKSKADEMKVVETVRKEKGVDVNRLEKQDLNEIPQLIVPKQDNLPQRRL